MRPRVGVVALLACVALSCAGIIGIDDRVLDDAIPDGGADGGSTAPDDGGAPDAPVDTPEGGLPTYGVGDGHSGMLTVTTGVEVNSYAPIAAAAAGATKLSYTTLRGAPFAGGDLVIVWQAAASAAPPSSNASVDPARADVGQWEVARVTAVASADDAGTSGDLTLDHALANAYATPGAQVVRVPEYTDVTIAQNQEIRAQPWDGTSGGIVAFYVKGTLTSFGTVQANGAGFRGGVGVVTGNSPNNCKALDGTPSNGYANKGEGIFPGAYGDTKGGMGNATIGGGGGDCYNSGGGGGGNGGAGGQGGFSGDGARDVGGRGGAAFTNVSVLERLTMGGGGGAGEVDNGRQINGGTGGGVVVIRAQEIAIPGGKIGARGGSPGKADYSGGAGGGAGGTILVQATGNLGCNLLSVLGGSGGSLETYDANNGPGGGGAGGRAYLQGGATACSVEVKGGTAGRDNTTTGTHGATPAIGQESSAPFVGAAQLVSSAYCATCP